MKITTIETSLLEQGPQDESEEVATLRYNIGSVLISNHNYAEAKGYLIDANRAKITLFGEKDDRATKIKNKIRDCIENELASNSDAVARCARTIYVREQNYCILSTYMT